jgi:hypothetical protein
VGEVILETAYKGGDFVVEVEYFEAGAGKYQVQILGKVSKFGQGLVCSVFEKWGFWS